MAKVIYVEEKLFYDSYQGEKASYITYIGRILKCKVPKERAILPCRLNITREDIKNKWKKKREDNPMWLFYDRYLGDKPSYKYFLDKVKAGMPLHEAIKREVKLTKYLNINNHKKEKKPKAVNNTYNDNKDDYYLIKITYPKEEAKVFRNVYIERLEDLEDRMLSCEPEEMSKLMNEDKQLKKELEVFNKWNPV